MNLDKNTGVDSREHSQNLKRYRLNQQEYEKITSLLGRPPRGVEWAVFSALWSEHCSYKSSRMHLKKFGKTLDEKVVNASGENAGVVDLGEGERIAFKMESHNHPSFIEPYQGAATGVGGILRDIFTMGARPIVLADYLCFGEPDSSAHPTGRMKTLVDGVVKGISGYGNCVGVPTVTGQTQFDSSYDNNILVNAMAVGLLGPGEKIALSGVKGVGNKVVYVGARTGKDGVHGAAMASESFDEDSDAKKPNVQIGDPYYEKLLIESCLEVIHEDLVVAIQDMGAAGLTSSSFEMASKGKLGLRLDLSRVPLRDQTMTPEEILLSESQERMLLIAEPGKLSRIREVFGHWGLEAVEVGEVLAQKKVEIWWHGEKLTEIDPDLLTEEAPMYNRPYQPWSFPRRQSATVTPMGAAQETKEIVPQALLSQLKETLSKVHHASKNAIYQQYDQRVGLLTASGAENDVALMRLPFSGRGLSIAVGCRASLMKLDAAIGATDAVFYPSLQMAIKGSRVMAVTDCLNFGNPEKPEIMSEFVASVESIAQASIALKAPVVSGNVSFYNETLGKNITSTPATGLIGLRRNLDKRPLDRWNQEGLKVYRLSEVQVGYSPGQSAEDRGKFSGGLDIARLTTWLEHLQSLSWADGVHATQMVSGGGLLLSLAQMCLPAEDHAGGGARGVGLAIAEHLTTEDLTGRRLYEALFAVKLSHAAEFETQLKAKNLTYDLVGVTGGPEISWRGAKIAVRELQVISEESLRRKIENLA